MVIWVSGTTILVFLLIIAGVAFHIFMNIASIIFSILMFGLFFIGAIVHIIQMKDSFYGATKLTGILALLSLFHAFFSMMFLKIELHWEITVWKIVICCLILIAVIAINAFACFLTDEKRNNFKMCLIPLGVAAIVAISCHVYFIQADKELAKTDIEDIHSYVVTVDSAEIYNVTTGTLYNPENKASIERDTMGSDVIDICYKGEILINEHDGIYGINSAQKIRTTDGIVGYIKTGNFEPYEYTTRYQLQYE